MKKVTALSCEDCWWFHRYLDENKGQCFKYGFTVDKDEQICCDYDR